MGQPRRRHGPTAGSANRRHQDNTSLWKTVNTYWNRIGKKFGVYQTSQSPKGLKPLQVKHPSEEEPPSSHSRSNTIKFGLCFKFVMSARICSALWSIISDCDETFNYWEPMHFLVEGWGLQTWEYSPIYAIRSYAYLWLHSLPSLLFKTFFGQQVSKVLLFYYTRFFLGIISAVCESYFISGVGLKFTTLAARLLLAIQVVSIGMMVSSTAFLPSSFSMYMTMLVLGGWMHSHFKLSILATISSVLIGWPFSGIISVPVGLHMLSTPVIQSTSSLLSSPTLKKKAWSHAIYLLKWIVVLFLFVSIPLVVIDSFHYGRLVLASFNIVIYNMMSGSKGPDLYGTEPWTFYPFNLLLNFNVMFIGSCALLPIFLSVKAVNFMIRGETKMKKKTNPETAQTSVIVNSYHFVILSILCLWYLIFFFQRHKEERFMFPIYPVICVSAALTLDLVNQLFALMDNLSFLKKINWGGLCLNLTLLVIFASALLSISRGITLFKGFHAPIDVYIKLEVINDNLIQWQNMPGNHSLNNEEVKKIKDTVFSVCVGKEWHRFPSSFFLPTRKWRLKFLKSHFAGQLPQDYVEDSSQGLFVKTRIIPSNMNDMNREEMSRYVPLDSCHFIVDTDYPNFASEDVPYSKMTETYDIIYSHPFLDVSRTEMPWRSLFIPFLTHDKWTMVNYNLLRNVNKTSMFPSHLFKV